MDYAKEIYDAAIADGMPRKMALLIVAQAKHETANFTSPEFLHDNNIAGYKYCGSKYQLAPGRTSTEGDKYGHYLNIQMGTTEVCEWVKRHIPNYETMDSILAYATALKKVGYYGAPLSEYVHGMTKYYQSDIA